MSNLNGGKAMEFVVGQQVAPGLVVVPESVAVRYGHLEEENVRLRKAIWSFLENAYASHSANSEILSILKRAVEENNEGDVPSPDGSKASDTQVGG
jgi:hypothetical protein